MNAFLAASVVLAGILSMSSVASARSEIMCTMQYDPVCGAKQVQCVKAPCYPQYETYGNSCMLGADGATFIHAGECTASEKGPWTGGETSYVPPAHCTAWFDGCNQCSRGADGSAACTLKACAGDPAPGYCTRYAQPADPEPASPLPPPPPAAAGDAATSSPDTADVAQPGFLESLWQRVLSWFSWL